MSGRLAIAVVLCAAIFPAMAEGPPGGAGALLGAMRDASGGARWDTLRGLHITASVVSGGVTGRLERWEDLTTGRYVESVVWPDHTTEDGFDGVTPWHRGRSGIAYALGDVDAALVAANESYRVARAWWFAARHAGTAAVAASRTDGGQMFDVLNITPEAGRPFDLWIDHATHLPARIDEQQAEDRVVTSFADFHDVGGVRLPFTIRTGDGVDAAADDVETVRTVDTDRVIPDLVFTIPPRPPTDIVLPGSASSVTVPFRLTADNRILLPLTINGSRTVQAEFDSGGSLLLQPATVAAAGLTAAGRFKQGGGGEGATTTGTGRIGTVAIGGAQIHGLAFHSFAFRPEDTQLALVGLEILQRFAVRFDFDRRVMTLTRPEGFAYRGSGAVIPFHFQDNQPEIKGSVDGIAGLFTIDTGSSGSLLVLAPFARRYGLVQRYQADVPYSGRAVTRTSGVWARKRPGTVAFDGADGRPAIAAHDPVTQISQQNAGFDANRDVSANIGLGILRQFNLTFDYMRQQIILEPNHFHGQREVFNRAGLRLQRQGGAWVVSDVYKGGAAEGLGVAVGDVVSQVDGLGPGALDAAGLWARLTAPVGTRLRLTVQGAGGTRAVVVSLRDLI